MMTSEESSTSDIRGMEAVPGGSGLGPSSRTWAEVVRNPDNGLLQAIVRMENPKNSCYAITAVNLFFSSPPLMEFLFNPATEEQLRPGSGDLLKALRELARLKAGQVGSVESVRILVGSTLNEINHRPTDVTGRQLEDSNRHRTDFTRSGQECPAEFFEALIYCLKNELVPNSNLLGLLLMTTVLEERRCSNAEVNSCPPIPTIHPHTCLLPLPVRGSLMQLSHSIFDSLDIFLNGNTGVIHVDCRAGTCRCKTATVTSKLQKMPVVLIVQLMRSVYDPRADRGVKLGHRVHIPLRFQPKEGGPFYTLTGAVNQWGMEAKSGHCVAFMRNVKDDTFTFADDDNHLRTELSYQQCERQLEGGYLFAYSRESAVADSRATAAVTTVSPPTSASPGSVATGGQRVESQSPSPLLALSSPAPSDTTTSSPPPQSVVDSDHDCQANSESGRRETTNDDNNDSDKNPDGDYTTDEDHTAAGVLQRLLADLQQLEDEKKRLQSVKPQLRTEDQKKRMKTLQNRMFKLKKKLPFNSSQNKRFIDLSEEEKRSYFAAKMREMRASQSSKEQLATPVTVSSPPPVNTPAQFYEQPVLGQTRFPGSQVQTWVS